MVDISNAATDPMLNTTSDGSGHMPLPPSVTEEQPISLVTDSTSSAPKDEVFFGDESAHTLAYLMYTIGHVL